MSWRTLLAGLSVAVLLLAGCGDDGEPSRVTMVDIELYDLDGQPAVVSHGGRPLVINFFAESCPPCVAEMPAFDSVYRTVTGEVDFVGVSEDATAAAARRIVEATGVSYPTVWDADGTAFAQFAGLGLPTTVFVAADGTIDKAHTGELSAEELTERIDALRER